jgi:hypothetical protein
MNNYMSLTVHLGSREILYLKQDPTNNLNILYFNTDASGHFTSLKFNNTQYK